MVYNYFMLLLTHIIIALASIIFTSFAWFKPTQNRLNISYTMFGLTLATGTVLVALNPSNFPQACMTGLLYSGFVGVELYAVRKKLIKV